MASANGHPAYRLHIRPRAGEQIERLRDRAIAGRLSRSFTEDVDAALGGIATDPFRWGNPWPGSVDPGRVRMHGLSLFLHVHYTVLPQRRIAVVRRVRANPFGPLA